MKNLRSDLSNARTDLRPTGVTFDSLSATSTRKSDTFSYRRKSNETIENLNI